MKYLCKPKDSLFFLNDNPQNPGQIHRLRRIDDHAFQLVAAQRDAFNRTGRQIDAVKMTVEKLTFIQLAPLDLKGGKLPLAERRLRADAIRKAAALKAGKRKVGIIERTVDGFSTLATE